MLRRFAVISLAAGLVMAATPAANFTGTWIFNPSKSTNVGMMASAELTSTITQTDKLLIVRDSTVFAGQKGTHEIRYDLSGTPVSNDSPMGGKAKTTSQWSGSKFVTSWTSEDTASSTKSVRTETRYLSEDGKTMFLKSSRSNKDPMIIVFDKK